jgi:colanic acid biosynthesis glycosyl transferase WcaI
MELPRGLGGFAEDREVRTGALRMRLLLVGLNYAPERVGIGPFTAGMAEWLAAAGHDITVVCAQPYYPEWRKADDAGWGWQTSVERGVTVIRCPIYVPRRPTGLKRLWHYLSFLLSAFYALPRACRQGRPDLVLSVAPSLFSAFAAILVARWFGVPRWLHVQDLELDAAVATGQMPGGARGARALARLERWLCRADRVSSLTPAMLARLEAKGVPASRLVQIPNWATVDPLAGPPTALLRDELGVDRPHVALFAGTLCRKQGAGLILEAARLLRDRTDILFLICGEGAERDALAAQAADLPNVKLRPLQPVERLAELLALASVHLLPQLADAADLVLPSKLANMLASGRPVVASAGEGSSLAREVAGCGYAVSPGEAAGFAGAITALIDDPVERARLGAAAWMRAAVRWNKERTLHALEAEMQACVNTHHRRPRLIATLKPGRSALRDSRTMRPSIAASASSTATPAPAAPASSAIGTASASAATATPA